MNEVSHVCENSPAKAVIRDNITSVIAAFVKGVGKSEYTYSSLCGADCTQEKEIRRLIPSVKFIMTGYENNTARFFKAKASGVMDKMHCYSIDYCYHNDDILYYDYCCSPTKCMGDEGFLPVHDVRHARNLALAENGSPRLLFYTFNLRDRYNGNHAAMQQIYDDIYGIGAWERERLEYEFGWSSPCFANFINRLFARMNNVYPVMFRVYHGGNGGKMGSPMLTIGLLICSRKDFGKFGLRVISEDASGIECLTEKTSVGFVKADAPDPSQTYVSLATCLTDHERDLIRHLYSEEGMTVKEICEGFPNVSIPRISAICARTKFWSTSPKR